MGLVDTVNDLAVLRVEPFDTSTAKRFVREAMATQDMELDADVQQRIVNILGTPIPYLLSLLMTLLLERHRMSGTPITVEMVDEVFGRDLLGGAATFFFHCYSRLRDYYEEDEERLAKAILGLLSRSDSSVRKDTLYQLYLRRAGLEPSADNEEKFQRLMQKLENDFYVTASNGGYQFSNRAIQIWWKNNYGFQSE